MTQAVEGGVRMVLRLEGMALLLLAAFAYAHWKTDMGWTWGWFAGCFFAPDLAFAAYLLGPRVGAVGYNLTHSLIGAVACLLVGMAATSGIWMAAGLIWCAHIGFDRALGYGLKYGAGFGFTHLGRIGRQGAVRGGD